MRIGVIASMKKGLEHFVYRELQVFSRQGYAISLFPMKFRRGLYNAEKEWMLHRWSPLRVVLLQPYFFLKSPVLYWQLLREALAVGALVDVMLAWYFSRQMAAVDVIYATFGDHKLFVGYFAKKIVKKPLAVTIHAYELYQNPNPDLFVRALEYCDQIVTVTGYNKELLESRFGIDPAKVEVVRITVNTEDYQPEKKFAILIAAFFVERKGHDVLFQAIRQLAQDDIEVWVVGDEGAEADSVDVRQMAVDLGIESQVAFFGKLSGNALKAVYRACDVFCLPCREDRFGVSEGFPTVIAEAMAFAKPVITTRHVEIPRIVEEIVVDENDVDGLAQAILEVYHSDSLRQRLGKKNRKLAEHYFTTQNAEKTAGILGSLAGTTTERLSPALNLSSSPSETGHNIEVTTEISN